ncbi:MAG: antibiotic biosynthesis monooxygenase [Bacteroidota bacterium]
MYMRLVEMKVDPVKLPEMREFYERTAIPALHAVRGCLFATLIQSNEHIGECISMTLWNTQAEAEEYGKSRIYSTLAEKIRTYLSHSNEWKIELSKDLTLEMVPILEEPIVKSYPIGAFENGINTPSDTPQLLYVRIVGPKIRQGMLEEFKQIYAREILPVLKKVRGCRYAFVTVGGKDKSDVMSVTVWDSQAAADEYEASGLFDQLKEKLMHTFTELYQWKMGLDKDTDTKTFTSDDMTVKHYQVVTGESFR